MAKERSSRKETTSDASFSIGEARKNFAELVNRAVYGRERIVITRYGKAVAEIVATAA